MLEWLRLGADDERVYRVLLARPHAALADVGRHLGLTEAQVRSCLEVLVDAELLRPPGADGRFVLTPPQHVLARHIEREETALGRRQAELDAARRGISELVDDFVSGQEPPDAAAAVQVLLSGDVVRARLYQLSADVQEQVRTILPDIEMSAESLDASLPLDLALLDRGVCLKVVCSRRLLEDAYAAAHYDALVDAGAQVRVHPGPPGRMVVLDDSHGLVPVDPAAVGRGAYLLGSPALVAPLVALFHEIWSAATPLRGSSAPSAVDGEVLDERIRLAVVLLAQGHKDAAVARRMSVSTRTVRRWLSIAMTTLRARSRLELAFEAARLGWLPSATIDVSSRDEPEAQGAEGTGSS